MSDFAIALFIALPSLIALAVLAIVAAVSWAVRNLPRRKD